MATGTAFAAGLADKWRPGYGVEDIDEHARAGSISMAGVTGSPVPESATATGGRSLAEQLLHLLVLFRRQRFGQAMVDEVVEQRHARSDPCVPVADDRPGSRGRFLRAPQFA